MVGPDTDPFAALPARSALRDGLGRVLVTFSPAEGTRDGRPWADCSWRPNTASTGETSSAILQRLPGYALSTSDTALVEALTGAGATEMRHAHVMSHPLATVPSVTPTLRLAVEPLSGGQLDRHAERLGAINVAAYPVGHCDHHHGDVAGAVREIRAIGRGEMLGPLMALSRVALRDNRIVGACLVVDREGIPPEGGPWIIDVFRDPACPERGVGRALLVSTLAATRSAGLTGISLAVSHLNATAFHLYDALGFVDVSESWTLAIPS